MKKRNAPSASALLAALVAVAVLGTVAPPRAHAANPASGFLISDVPGPWTNPTGLLFGPNAAGTKERAYVWQRDGKVWIVEDGAALPTPLIDLSEEVGAWRDYGLLGFALDPNFQTNGYIYLLYVVDRHHLLHYGTPSYNPAANEYFNATIGRVTRYQARVSDDFRSVEPTSRTVLLGATPGDGIPVLHQSHGVGSLLFGVDGTLLVFSGDGASYDAVDDGGSDGNSYAPQGVADGIIPAAENIGAFRSQMLDSLSGKILRIDPATGLGVESNPFYQSGAPGSKRSRVWAYGARNPYRACLRPGTGSHDPADANPGTIYFGEVGWGWRDEMNVCDGPGRNFGWPLREGVNLQLDYIPRKPAWMPDPVHTLPKFDWRTNETTRVTANNTQVWNLGASGAPVGGPNFTGSASTGGTWYTGDTFPAAYQNTYFHADFVGEWIKAFTFDENNNPTGVMNFVTNTGPVVFVATDPAQENLYYVSWTDGVKKVSYAPGGNFPPSAVAALDTEYGPGPLAVNFSSAGSSDPEGQPLSYAWNFGDGSPINTSANPAHVFTATAGVPTRYDVTLTVTDAGGASDQATLIVSVNNTPPVVAITSPLDGTRYPLDQGDVAYPLNAAVADSEHANNQLSYQWQTVLYHNEHFHEEPIDTNFPSSTMISPIPPGEDVYHYRVYLKVTDPAGLSTTVVSHLYPNGDGVPVFPRDDFATGIPGHAVPIDVLANDAGAVFDADPATMTVVDAPDHGVTSVDPSTGLISYTHNGSFTTSDSFTYRVTTIGGEESDEATVTIDIERDWAAFTGVMPGATGDPAGNSDGDLDDEATEFALGGSLSSGAYGSCTLEVTENGGVISATYVRPVGLGGLTYALEKSSDFGGWFLVNTAPTVSAAGIGLERVTYTGLQNENGLSATSGIVRLKIMLHDVSPEHTAYTLPQSWYRVTMNPGLQSFGISLRRPACFASRVISASNGILGVHGDAGLDPARAYFIELIDGPLEGHRFEVDPQASGADTVALVSGHSRNTLNPVPDFTGARFVLCAHDTLGGVFDKNRFSGSTNISAADQVQFFEDNGSGSRFFQIYYLLDARPAVSVHEWRVALPQSGDQGGRVIAPGEGMLVKRGAGTGPINLFVTGQVRGNRFRQPLLEGYNFVGEGFPRDHSPVQRQMLDPAFAFTASTNANAADQIQTFDGTFKVYYLLDHPSQGPIWRETLPNQVNHNNSPLFRYREANFIRRAIAAPGYGMPPTWNP